METCANGCIQRYDPPDGLIDEARDELMSIFDSSLPNTFQISALKKYEQKLAGLKAAIYKEKNGKEKFGKELLDISEKYFSKAAFDESDRLNSRIAAEFEGDIVGAVANSRLGYSKETVGNDRHAASKYYEKAMDTFQKLDLKNEPTLAYAAMQSMSNAADNYLLAGQGAEAEEIFRHLLDSEDFSNVPFADVRLNASNELALILSESNRFLEAASRFKQAASFVDDSSHPQAFKEKLFISFWESESQARAKASQGQSSDGITRSAFDTAALEQIWNKLKGKSGKARVHVAMNLLLCFRFDKDEAWRKKIPELADEIIQMTTGETDRYPHSVYVQAYLLKLEYLKEQKLAYKEVQSKLMDRLEKQEFPDYKPVVGKRFPDHLLVKQNLKDIFKEQLQDVIASRKAKAAKSRIVDTGSQ